MGAIHNKIKQLRTRIGLTQQEMSEKMSMHLKTWQKIENGVTRLDIDRLKIIAEILETSVEDLINADDTVFINEIRNNDVGFNNNSVTIQHRSELEKELYERLISEKDRQIQELHSQLEVLKELISKFKLN